MGDILFRVGAIEGADEDMGFIEGTAFRPGGPFILGPKIIIKKSYQYLENLTILSDNIMRKVNLKTKSYLAWC